MCTATEIALIERMLNAVECTRAYGKGQVNLKPGSRPILEGFTDIELNTFRTFLISFRPR